MIGNPYDAHDLNDICHSIAFACNFLASYAEFGYVQKNLALILLITFSPSLIVLPGARAVHFWELKRTQRDPLKSARL